MSAETPLIAAAAAILIAVIGLVASVHYRLGKLEKGQESLAANQEKGDAETREMIVREIDHTRRMMVEGDTHTRELLAETRDTLTQEITHTSRMIVEGDTHTRELLAETRDMLVKENAHTRRMIVEGDTHTRELLAETRDMLVKENAHTRELLSHTRELLMQEIAASRARSDAQHAETMGAIQRLTDAFLSHSHDIDGTIRFRIPPPLAAPPGQQEE